MLIRAMTDLFWMMVYEISEGILRFIGKPMAVAGSLIPGYLYARASCSSNYAKTSRPRRMAIHDQAASNFKAP